MKLSPIVVPSLVLLLAPLLTPVIADSSGSVYLVQKQQLFLQTGAGTPAAFPLYPFEMSIQAAAATNLVTAAGTVALTDSGNGSPGLQANFATQAALDTAFPNGTFAFSGPPAYSVTLAGDLYPTTTPAVVSGGTWVNGVLVIDPAVATTLGFSTFAGYANTGSLGHIAFSTNAQDGSNSGSSQDQVSSALLSFTVSATPLTSFALPAGTLKAGVVYQAELDFDTASSVDTHSISGGALIGLYSKTLSFYIVGKPATTATPITVNALSNVVGAIGSAVTIPVSGTGLTGATAIATWFKNGAQFDFGNGGHYSILNGQSLVINGATSADAGKYFAIIVGPGGLAVTNEISVSLVQAVLPQITTQPTSVTVAGGTVVFNVTATGGGLSYQWKFNGVNVAGNATTSRLILGGVNSGSAGNYTCVVANGAGAVTSAQATLTVLAQSANLNSRLVNESVSSSVPAGSGLTVGFLVGGSGTSSTQTLPLLIRGIGPTLGAFPGITGTMPDPTIQIIPLTSSTAIASNDNWGSNLAAVTAADASTGAFPLNVGSLDAALTIGLSAGGYSVVLTPNGPGGLALAEIYDNILSGTYQATAPRIVNLSALTSVPAGGTLAAGFFLGGSTARTVLIRAIGPTLASFPGHSGYMPDPKLTLVKTADGSFVAGNQGWGGDSTLASIAVQAGGFPFASPTTLDSAVLVTLLPGVGYTASATSASLGGGDVLIEIYEVP